MAAVNRLHRITTQGLMSENRKTPQTAENCARLQWIDNEEAT